MAVAASRRRPENRVVRSRRLYSARSTLGPVKSRKRRYAKPASAPARRRCARPNWADLTDDELLDVRLCELGLAIEGTVLASRIERLYEELDRRGIVLRPHCWLSQEWFAADGVPGIAIPFYLAHPRLMKLEQRQMLEVEGGTRESCLRILRHEAGHALDTAYRLHRRRQWQQMFGKASTPYPEFYQPKPYSKNFVLHLDSWYAQSHPAEDFAETFAVWLRPASRWRQTYAGWPALKKLEYVEGAMTEVAGTPPLVRSRERIEPLSETRITLRQHYDRKRAHYATRYPEFYDRDLRRLFSDAPLARRGEAASAFLRRIGPDVRATVSHWTGVPQYTIDQVLQEIIVRCRQLKLRLDRSERQARQDATVLLTVQTMTYLQGGRRKLAM